MYRVKVRFKAGSASAKDAIKSGAFYENNRHPMAVTPEEEERHRDEAYKKTGITRVKPSKEDPNFERWKEQQREQQNRGGGKFQDSQGR